MAFAGPDGGARQPRSEAFIARRALSDHIEKLGVVPSEVVLDFDHAGVGTSIIKLPGNAFSDQWRDSGKGFTATILNSVR
jgi:hypothetical protein